MRGGRSRISPSAHPGYALLRHSGLGNVTSYRVIPTLNHLSFTMETSDDRAMIELRSPLRIESHPPGGWQLILWTGDVFDFTTPFRGMLGDIAEALGQDRQNDLHLPPYEVNEDFVEGTLRFGSTALRIYYEHSLSYLALMSDSEDTLRAASDRIQRICSSV